jgi:hypothetical protein
MPIPIPRSRVLYATAAPMIDFYCFENTDKTNRFDSDWGTKAKTIQEQEHHITNMTDDEDIRTWMMNFYSSEVVYEKEYEHFQNEISAPFFGGKPHCSKSDQTVVSKMTL